MGEIEKDIKRFTKFAFITSEAIYPTDAVVDDDIDINKLNIKYEDPEADENEEQYDTLKEAIGSFLESKNYNDKEDGKVFYAQQDSQVYVGFERVKDDGNIHEYLAMFYRLEIEVSTSMESVDVTMKEIEEAFND